MDEVKIINFKRDHPSEPFPSWRSLGSEECSRLRGKLAARFGVAQAAADAGFVEAVHRSTTPLSGYRATDPSFEFGAVLAELRNPVGDRLLLNWYRYDDIDEMKKADFVRYFDDIWYPSSDDLEVFDSTCAWVLSISHAGDLRIADRGA